MANFVLVSKAAQQSTYTPTYIRTLLRNKQVKGKNIGVWLVDLDDLKRYEKEMDTAGTKKFTTQKNLEKSQGNIND